MKVTLTPETDEEKAQIGEPREFAHCLEFVLAGRRRNDLDQEGAFIHRHVADRYWLIGKLAEAMERLRADV